MNIIPQVEKVCVGSSEITVKEYRNQRVVTFKDIDLVHGRPDGTASRNFRENREHFIDGKDFMKITPDEFRRSIGDMDLRQSQDITLITESGYLMLVKSFTDDKAWEVQRSLVDNYFKVRAIATDVSPQLQMIQGILNGLIEQERAQKEIQQRIEKVDTSLENIKEAVRPVTDNWREEINKKFNRIQKCCSTDFRFLRSEMYNELDSRAGSDVHTRLRNMKDRMTEQGSTKTAVSNLNLMDVIEDDKKLREIFSKIVSEYEIKYCA